MLFSHIADQDLDLHKVKNILNDIKSRNKTEKLHLPCAMNNCLIMAGIYIQPLSDFASTWRRVAVTQTDPQSE